MSSASKALLDGFLLFEVDSAVDDCIDKDVAASYLQQTYCEIGIPCHTWAKLVFNLINMKL